MRDALDAEYDLGVVFVHGIGIQPQGSTLLEFGTSLMEWLRDRMAITDEVKPERAVSPERVVLTSEAGEPAHAVIRLKRSDGLGRGQRWLLTEAWWASSFPVPSFTDLAQWSLSVVPWTFGQHYGKRVQRVLNARTDMRAIIWASRLAGSLAVLLVGLVASLIVLMLLLVLQVLALIPISGVRSWIGRIQRSLASSAGDSYSLVTRPLEEAAMVKVVRDTVAWTAEHAEAVAIVAHSQGSAVAFTAVEDAADPRLKLLVTFGSGLQKLEDLRYVMKHRSFQAAAGLTLVGMLLTFAGGWAIAIELSVRQGITGLTAVDVWILFISGVLLLAVGLWDLIAGIDTRLGDRILRPWTFDWLDIYASADPVPNGSLIEKDGKTGRVSPLEVVNLGSMIRDHTAYWRNRDQFVSAVASSLLRLVGDLGLTPTDDQQKTMNRVRHGRVALLRAAVWLAVVGLFGLALRYFDAWFEVGRWAIVQAQAWLPWIPEVAATASDPEFGIWVRSIGALGVVLVVFAVACAAWSIWNFADMRAGIRGMTPSVAGRNFFGLTLSAQAVVVELAIPFSFGWRALAGLGSLMIVVVAITSAPRLPADSSGIWRDAEAKRPKVLVVAGWLLAALFSIGFFIAMLQDELGWQAEDSVLLTGTVVLVVVLVVVLAGAKVLTFMLGKFRPDVKKEQASSSEGAEQ